MVIFAGLPIFFGPIFLGIWKLISLTNRQRFQHTYKRSCLTTILVFVFLLYPTITTYAFRMFSCIEIEGVHYLEKDTSLECWGSSHLQALFYFYLPIILIWGIGYLVLIFILLYRSRNNLNQSSTIMKYGLYYIGFKDKSFYW